MQLLERSTGDNLSPGNREIVLNRLEAKKIFLELQILTNQFKQNFASFLVKTEVRNIWRQKNIIIEKKINLFKSNLESLQSLFLINLQDGTYNKTLLEEYVRAMNFISKCKIEIKVQQLFSGVLNKFFR